LLDDTKVTGAGLDHLRGLNDLEFLLLNNNRIGDAGLSHLVGLKHLQLLSLQLSGVTASGVEALQKSLPKTRIVWR
jgi:internalin A